MRQKDDLVDTNNLSLVRMLMTNPSAVRWIIYEYRARPGNMPILLFDPQVNITFSVGDLNQFFPSNSA